MTYTENEIKAVSEALKMHFNNLSVSQALTITFDILRKLKEAQENDKQTNNNQSK